MRVEPVHPTVNNLQDKNMTETNYQRVEFQIPHEWKKKLDEKGSKFGCTTTSETIRYLIRDFIT